MRRPALLSGLLVGASLLTAAPAAAFWSIGPSTDAAGYAKAGTLGLPAVSAAVVLVVNVQFSVSTPPPGISPEGYRVTRAGTTVCTINGPTGSCSSGLTAGDQFQITAFRGLWNGPAQTCNYGLLGGFSGGCNS